MNKYELMAVINAHLGQTEKDALYKQTIDTIVKSDGKVVNNQVWLEKHRLPFMIKKCKEATYYLVKFEALPGAIEKIKQAVRLNEEVLRFMISRVEDVKNG